MYIVRKYKILFVRDLEICRKVSLCRVQMCFIFSDNVHILHLSCNVKKSKLPKKSRKKHRFNRLLMASVVKSGLILLPFLTFAQHESDTRKKYISDRILKIIIQTMQFDCSNRTSAG
jgi:hypothetical protein